MTIDWYRKIFGFAFPNRKFKVKERDGGSLIVPNKCAHRINGNSSISCFPVLIFTTRLSFKVIEAGMAFIFDVRGDE